MAATTLLRDGRMLAWRTYGRALDRGGFPVVFMHGNLNSRMFAPAWGKTHEEANDAGAHVLAVDRPGYGASCAHPGRTYRDWAHDVKELADHLRLERYAVVGYSSGGPHALACAAVTGRRVAACGLVSSDAPYARMRPGMIEEMYGATEVDVASALARAATNSQAMRAAYRAIANGNKRELALACLDTATAQGLEGAASDSVLEARASWGFEMTQVAVPVLLWHGTEDKDVPLEAAHFLADALAASPATVATVFCEGENHTLIRRWWKEILTQVVAVAQGESGEEKERAGSGGGGGA